MAVQTSGHGIHFLFSLDLTSLISNVYFFFVVLNNWYGKELRPMHDIAVTCKVPASTWLNESTAPGCLQQTHTHLQDAISGGLVVMGSRAAPIHQPRPPAKIRALSLWQQGWINNTYCPLFPEKCSAQKDIMRTSLCAKYSVSPCVRHLKEHSYHIPMQMEMSCSSSVNAKSMWRW